MELSERAVELRSSRQRVVAVADAERRRLERDIHDGAQQYLIALAINLALARELLAQDPERVPPLMPALHTAVHDAMAVLHDLGRGLYPHQLAGEGVAAALRAATANSAVPVTIEDASRVRYPPDIEAAAYFACLEAVQNAVKHSGGSRVGVRLTGGSDALGLEITDDGDGFDVEAKGAAVGTVTLRDRLATVRGHAEVVSSSGRGTRVRGWIPAPIPASADRSP
jgi:signal transduction histidine kinase